MITPNLESQVQEFLRKKGDGLYHREGQELEFKEQFNFGGLAEYFRDFAAFANNRGGFLIFGITNSPRRLKGLSDKSFDQFDKVDPETITRSILKIFSRDISWEHDVVVVDEKKFGYFYVHECSEKPVIAKSDEGKDQEIRNGDIYYRYGGRTQRIQAAELESIISKRIEDTNQSWMNLLNRIGRIGPQNAAILDSEAGLIEKSPDQILVIDDELADKLKFVKEGSFSEKKGSTTLKLIGDVVPVNKLEVVRKVKEHLTRSYPLSAMELCEEIRKRLPDAKQGDIWEVIKANQIKENPDYSAYNFRNKKHEDEYKEKGILRSGTPSIYNSKCVEFITKILEEK